MTRFRRDLRDGLLFALGAVAAGWLILYSLSVTESVKAVCQ